MHDEAYKPKPDCAVCGQTYHRHNVGTMTTCPIIATYKPLPPANTEADVERERLARCLEGYATGMDRFHRDIADDFRKAASIVRGAALATPQQVKEGEG